MFQTPRALCFRLQGRCVSDSKGNPRCITNSKGKKRRVSSKDLQQALKTSDANFLDFVRRCLESVVCLCGCLLVSSLSLSLSLCARLTNSLAIMNQSEMSDVVYFDLMKPLTSLITISY